MRSFLSLAVMTVSKSFEKEIFVVGIEEMVGAHDAEQLKAKIEHIINKFKFDRDRLRKSLIENIKKKFNFELNSKMYKVAALFCTSKLNVWFSRSFSQKIILDAASNIKEIAIEFLNRKDDNPPTAETTSSDSSESDDEIESSLNLFKKMGKEVSSIFFLRNK